MGGQAQSDAVVVDEVLRFLRFRSTPEIRRCAHDCHAHVRPDAHGDHVLRHLLAASYAGVKLVGHDIGRQSSQRLAASAGSARSGRSAEAERQEVSLPHLRWVLLGSCEGGKNHVVVETSGNS
jgi:hypothetical protein